jgi:hypothetical protein
MDGADGFSLLTERTMNLQGHPFEGYGEDHLVVGDSRDHGFDDATMFRFRQGQQTPGAAEKRWGSLTFI